MKKPGSIILVLITLILIYYIILKPYISNYVGWYGYKVWENRSKTETIKESKERKVFVKELQYQIEYSGDIKNFHFIPYIEKGFKISDKSIKDTRIITGTNFPYNICFERNLKDSIAIYYKKQDEKKLDSFDGYWGYLKSPYLKDSLYLQIDGESNNEGVIKIW
ncbi:hypothetical protein [Chryseobacterium profundimaris]|uniref:Uncharacterized protein n=1 Tax=Chryseobacterium profundimaris TaxID=1387275 RepID=A0ABY1NXE0_9FLAO|nr:hypothetical protein [Chryseobacterium profundimaris]SMP21092.1 hypothetical protein SAMN06264346_1064 [Chryseobacterium profundimaris]